MARYSNNATVHGANAGLPRVNDLINIINYQKWLQLPQLPPRYTLTLGPGGATGGTAGQSSGRESTTPARGGGGNASGGCSTCFVDVAPNSVLMAGFECTAKGLGDLTHNEALIP
jgi:hypothetical protein